MGKSGNCRDIVLLEVISKTMYSLLNRRLVSVITFHDVLHSFQGGRGTGTATLDTKLLKQLKAMREAVLFGIFLDIHKAYNALYQDRYLGILAAYGDGLRTIQLLRTYWGRLTMVARAGGYFGVSFKGYRSVT